MKLIFITAAMLVDEKNPNAPTAENVRDLISGDIMGPDPEGYGIIGTAVRAEEIDPTYGGNTTATLARIMTDKALKHAAEVMIEIASK